MSNVTLDENTDMQARAYLDMHCCKGTPSKVSHPSDWTQHTRFKLSQCNSYNPIAFAFIIGLDPNLHGKGKLELDDVTMALFLTYNKKFQETDKAANFLQFRRRFRAFVRPCERRTHHTLICLHRTVGEALHLSGCGCKTINWQLSKRQRSHGSTGMFPSRILVPFSIQGNSQCTPSVRIQHNPQPPSPCTQQTDL
eukprot:15324293-Ditylum_brightwellii.AAC.1